VLFYATDDERAATTIERLIATSGFDAVKAGGLGDTIRIEVFGDLHQFGGLNGSVVDADQARAAVAAVPATA
jgi:8-hydroxy-5-deazaflavin:NADPH oxidoreductase